MFQCHPELLSIPSIYPLNHEKTKNKDDHKTIWKLAEKNYLNNPRQLILDKNQLSSSVLHRWEVTNWSSKKGQRLESAPFYVADAQFKVLCYPTGNVQAGGTNSGVAMYVCGEVRPNLPTKEHLLETEWSACVHFELSIINQEQIQDSVRWWSDGHHYQFSSQQSSWGRHSIIKHVDMYKKEIMAGGSISSLTTEEEEEDNDNDNETKPLLRSEFISPNDTCIIECRLHYCNMVSKIQKRRYEQMELIIIIVSLYTRL